MIHVILNGNPYSIRRVPTSDLQPDRLGDCQDPTDASGGFAEIRISSDLSGLSELTTTRHELLHGCHYELFSEQFVSSMSESLARALYDMGWRRS